MEGSQCQICREERHQVAAIPVAELVTQYRKLLSVDVAAEFGALQELRMLRCPQCDFTSFEPRIVGSRQFYGALQQHAWYYLEEKPEFVTARRFIQPADRVLDVGCGSGTFAQGHPVENYVGLEYTAEAVARAQARGLTVVQQDLASYAAGGAHRHDVVCAFQVLEHVADQRAFIRDCAQACRPGGRLIFSTPNAGAFVALARNVVLNLPPHHTAWFSRRFWLSLPDYFPLRLVEVVEEPLEPVHVPFYAGTLAQVSFERWMGWDNLPLVDGSLRQRVLNRLAGYAGRWLAHGLAEERLRPKGQSITVVYERCAE